MSAGDTLTGLAVGLVAAFLIAAVFGWRPFPGGLPGRRWPVKAWTSVWVDGGRIVAEGIADESTIVTERFSIDLNGRPVRMIVLGIEFGGGAPRWQAQDVASYVARYRVQGIRARGAQRA